MLQREDPVFQRYFRKSWGDFFLISLSNFLVCMCLFKVHICDDVNFDVERFALIYVHAETYLFI